MLIFLMIKDNHQLQWLEIKPSKNIFANLIQTHFEMMTSAFISEFVKSRYNDR